MTELTLKPPAELGLYIHLPWCVMKCPYCDFNSHTGVTRTEEYVAALICDLEFELLEFPHLSNNDSTAPKINSIFFGGGTPSLFPAKDIGAILTGCKQRLNISAQAEITLEANPGASEQARFEGYHAAGVNRLSIGVQSFNDAHLKSLGRIHSAAEAKNAFQAARNAGFSNINLDLMYALPNQTVEQAVDDCKQVIALQPEHISHYQLTIEAGTAFGRRPPPLPDDDDAWEMQLQCQALLAQAGYEQYEVSAYALNKNIAAKSLDATNADGSGGSGGFSNSGNTSDTATASESTIHQCQHNLNYWQYGDYLGIGAGAHGKITHLMRDQSTNISGITRRARRPNPTGFMNSAGSDDALSDNRLITNKSLQHGSDVDNQNTNQTAVQESLIGEFMLNAMRLNQGFSWRLFHQTTGLDAAAIQPELNKLTDLGLLQQDHTGVRPTAFGRQHLNAILLAFD